MPYIFLFDPCPSLVYVSTCLYHSLLYTIYILTVQFFLNGIFHVQFENGEYYKYCNYL